MILNAQLEHMGARSSKYMAHVLYYLAVLLFEWKRAIAGFWHTHLIERIG